MGAYGGGGAGNEVSYGGGDGRSQWSSPAEQQAVGSLAEHLAGLGVGDASSKESLFQVMNAVEAAESIIKQQLEENKKLRMELQMRTRELEHYKTDASSPIQKYSTNGDGDHNIESVKARLPISLGMAEGLASEAHVDVRLYSDNSKINGMLDTNLGGKPSVDSAGISLLSSPISRSFSSSRYQREGEDESKFNVSGLGLMPMSESNNTINQWKQELILKVREREEEIAQLRKHLADYSVKAG